MKYALPTLLRRKFIRFINTLEGGPWYQRFSVFFLRSFLQDHHLHKEIGRRVKATNKLILTTLFNAPFQALV